MGILEEEERKRLGLAQPAGEVFDAPTRDAMREAQNSIDSVESAPVEVEQEKPLDTTFTPASPSTSSEKKATGSTDLQDAQKRLDQELANYNQLMANLQQSYQSRIDAGKKDLQDAVEDDETRKKNERRATAYAALSDAFSSVANLIGTIPNMGMTSMQQTYASPFLQQAVERDRRIRNGNIERMRERLRAQEAQSVNLQMRGAAEGVRAASSAVKTAQTAANQAENIRYKWAALEERSKSNESRSKIAWQRAINDATRISQNWKRLTQRDQEIAIKQGRLALDDARGTYNNATNHINEFLDEYAKTLLPDNPNATWTDVQRAAANGTLSDFAQDRYDDISSTKNKTAIIQQYQGDTPKFTKKYLSGAGNLEVKEVTPSGGGGNFNGGNSNGGNNSGGGGFDGVVEPGDDKNDPWKGVKE